MNRRVLLLLSGVGSLFTTTVAAAVEARSEKRSGNGNKRGGGAGSGKGQETLEDRMRRLEDIEDIRRLRNMYVYFINEGQKARMRELYTDDGVFEIGGKMKLVGIDAIVEGMRKGSHRTSLVKQFVHSHQIDIVGDIASAFAYLDARYAQDGVSLMLAARYDEKYVRTPAGWRISTTYVHVFFAVPPQEGWAGKRLDYMTPELLRDR